MINKIGYACINSTLGKDGVCVNRGMIRKTFLQKGVSGVSPLALQNVQDMYKILEWNELNDIKFYRMTSNLFPWASEYDLVLLPNWEEILFWLKKCGDFAKEKGHRLTFHPGPFNCLASQKENVIINSIKDLSIHGEIMDHMGLPRTQESKINIHVGGAYGDHTTAMETFCKNFDKLPESAKTRLTIENDDKKNMFNITLLYNGIHKKIGTPVVFDWHHYDCGPLDVPKADAFQMALSTWPSGIIPVCHHSSPRTIEDKSITNKTAHADFIYEPFNSHGKTIDLMLECKAKEGGVLKYKQDFIK